MFRCAPLYLVALLVACVGPGKDVGALDESTGSDGHDGTGEVGSASMSSTSASGSATSTSTTDDSGGEEDTVALDVAPDCACDDDQICTPEGCFGGQVYLAFDGVTLLAGVDDATQNTISIDELVGEMQSYGGDAGDRAVLLQAVRDRFSEVRLWITDERPTDEPYTMVVLGDNLDAFGGTIELSLLHCDGDNLNPVVFAGVSADDGLSLDLRASAIAQGIGHAYGLEHDSAAGSVMNPINPGNAFVDVCEPLTAVAECVAQHQEHCDAGEQNALAELQARFGAP